MWFRDRRKIVCFVFTIVSIAVGSFAFRGLSNTKSLDSFYFHYILSAILELFFIGLPALFLLYSGVDRWLSFRATMHVPDKMLTGLSMLAAVSLTIVSGIIGILWQYILEAYGLVSLSIALPNPESAIQWAVAFMTAAIMPAFCEEMMFRGLVLGLLGRKFSSKIAISLSAVLFALCHLNIEGFPSLLMIGYLLATVMFKQGIIWLPILIHAVYNASSIIINANVTDISITMIILCIAVFLFSARYLLQKGDSSCS